MEVAPEGVGVLGAEVGLDAAQGEVHHREAAGGGVALLAVDADVAELPAVGLDEFRRGRRSRPSHTRGLEAAFVGLQHLHDEGDEALRGEVLAALFALGDGELAEEILIDVAEDVT